MTSLDLNRASDPIAGPPLAPSKPPSRIGRAFLAGFLSLLAAGLGQFYNRQPRKAIAFAIFTFLIIPLVLRTPTIFDFGTMLGVLVISLVWRLFMIVEAARAAAKARNPEPVLPRAEVLSPLFLAAIIGLALIPLLHAFDITTKFPTFVLSSNSMCPTMCQGDRVISDLRAYESVPPQRGDLVVFLRESKSSFTKRVIAIPGDTVAPGPGGTVLVNGAEFRPHPPCGPPLPPEGDPSAPLYFAPTVVPPNSFFVVGDNLNASFDSRSFGPIAASSIQGRPVYTYWSPEKSRRGCHLQ
jgi:signal peptidase I